MNSAACPLSPTRIHRVYYSARRDKPLGVTRECRDCSQTIAFIDGAWRVPPPGEIVVGLMAEFQARMIEGDPNRIGEPRGIFGAATRSDTPGLTPAELIALSDRYRAPRIPS